jgi:hypothetical protein
MKYVTYLIYIVLFESLIFGGVGYAVFVLGHSGWWFVFALFVSSAAYTPSKWYGIVEPPSESGGVER